jgi:hypothetical protein
MKEIVRYRIEGARRWSNYIWGTALTIGGLGFLITGISCYFQIQQFNFFHKVL